jgi:hypothetical protein
MELGGAGGVAFLPREIHPGPSLIGPIGPVQQEDAGWQLVEPDGQNCHTSHESDAQQAFSQSDSV